MATMASMSDVDRLQKRISTTLQVGKDSKNSNMLCVLVLGSNANKKEITCDKTKLANMSEVFHAMFFGPLQEKGEKIYIPDVQPELFKFVIQFMDCKHVSLESSEQAFQLLYVTKKYLLSELKSQCFKRICSDLNIHNVCNFYEVAIQYDEYELAEHCMEFIKLEACDVLQHPSFLEISQASLKKIVEQNGLNVPSELIVINACIKWARNEAQKCNLPCGISGMRQVLGPVFSLLRFLSLTPTQFAEGPAKSDLISCEEGYSILLFKLSRYESIHLPEHICKEKSPRNYIFQQFPFYSTIYKDFIKICRLSDPADSNHTIEYLDYYYANDPEVHILRFTTDKDILLLGFELASQTDFNEDSQISSKPSYNENVRAVIYVNERDTSVTIFKAPANYNKLITVKFKKPIHISENIEQEILFEYFSTGSYKALKYTSRLRESNVGNVKFELDQKDSDGMVYSIIFTDCTC